MKQGGMGLTAWTVWCDNERRKTDVLFFFLVPSIRAMPDFSQFLGGAREAAIVTRRWQRNFAKSRRMHRARWFPRSGSAARISTRDSSFRNYRTVAAETSFRFERVDLDTVNSRYTLARWDRCNNKVFHTVIGTGIPGVAHCNTDRALNTEFRPTLWHNSADLSVAGSPAMFPVASCCCIANIISLRARQAPKLDWTVAPTHLMGACTTHHSFLCSASLVIHLTIGQDR